MQSTLPGSVPISPVLDHLISRRVIGYETRLKVTHNCNGCSPGIPQAATCWARLIEALRKKRHPRAFIELRQALVDEFQWIVHRLDDEQDDCDLVPSGKK